MQIFVSITNGNYDLDQPSERQRLRNDLMQIGFFSVEDNKKYYETFDKERVPKVELTGLFTAFKWFEVTVQKFPLTKN